MTPLAKKRILSALLVSSLGLALVLGILGNIRARKGGILDDALLVASDRILLQDRAVARAAPDFSELVSIVRQFPSRIGSPESLRTIAAFHAELRSAFPTYTIISPASVSNFRNEDGALVVGESFVDFTGSDVEWRRHVRSDAAVFGTLVSRDYLQCAFVLALPPGYDEVIEFRRIVSFLEGHDTSELGWRFKKDIVPRDETMLVAGWPLARGLIDAATNADILVINTVGLLLALIVLIWLLGSPRQALIGLGIILGALALQRASIGLLGPFGLRERAYVVLAYGTTIVMGVSFVLHAFTHFNRMGSWKASQRAISGAFGLTAAASLLGFASLRAFPIRTIAELGTLCIVSLIALLYFTLLVLPFAANWLGVTPCTTSRSSRTWKLPLRVASHLRPSHVLMILVLTTMVAAGVIVSGAFRIGSEPLDFIRGTYIFRSHEALDTPTGLGFSVQQVYLQSPTAEARDPTFIRASARYAESVQRLPSVSSVSGPLGTLQRIADERFGEPLALLTDEQLRYAFDMLESGTDGEVAEQLWTDDGLRLLVASTAGGSRHQRELVDSMERIAAPLTATHPLLFGRNVLYTRFNQYIILGKPLNALADVVAILLVGGTWILMSRQRRRTQSAVRVGLVLVIPFWLASNILVVAMAVTGTPLDVATAAIGGIVIAASIDFSIYIVHAYVERRAGGVPPDAALAQTMDAESAAVAGDALVNAVCFAPLLLSRFEPVVRLGGMMLVMLMASVLGALFIVPVLLRWSDRLHHAGERDGAR